MERFDNFFALVFLFATKNLLEGVLLVELSDVESGGGCECAEGARNEEIVDEEEVVGGEGGR